ncbi:MAG: hypothetical protein LBQ59_01560 [Candidatus Peribacteria bacterium]|nr:hypothetical protein [Candidatus Peribacteria bacterium]
MGILVSESYNKYKEISLSEIKKNDVNIEEILKKAIEENYNRLNLDSKKVLLDSITIIKEYLLTKEQIPETI